MAPKRSRGPETIAAAIHPNAALRAAYRKKLQRLIDEMGRSFAYWIKAAYRANEPRMAMDATPAKELQRAVELMARRWEGRFAEAAPELARWFAQSARRRTEEQLRRILRDGGISVRFQMTRAMRDVLDATVEQNVQLIKSIPQQFLTQVQGSVMRSVQAGRDVGALTKELQENFGVTRKRAAFIALDQNNKATSALQRARQTELGLDEGVWIHSHGGKEPRPTHVKNDGKRFSIAEGWFDPDPRVRKRIMPGELIHCRCVWRVVIKGFS